MERVYNSIQAFWSPYLDDFMAAQRTGKYKKFTNNPCYSELKAINDAMNVIRKEMGKDAVKLSNAIKLQISWEKE
jgi:uncharacterized protein YgiB involved in biofilm formation